LGRRGGLASATGGDSIVREETTGADRAVGEPLSNLNFCVVGGRRWPLGDMMRRAGERAVPAGWGGGWEGAISSCLRV
jgi:hypothetical protein